MKIVVYAICKNEEKFAYNWVQSMSEADAIYVLDTGSQDNSVQLLKKLGVHVFRHTFKSFRFDLARNYILKRLPENCDLCVCTDLDERFEKGWRKKLEDGCNAKTNRVYYTYNWKLENGKPIISFLSDKIHSRFGYKWIYPVHEVLVKTNRDSESAVTIENITLNHFPDQTKPRSYLALLEKWHSAQPLLSRANYYLAREYYFLGKFLSAIRLCIKYLGLKNATWSQERSAVHSLCAKCYCAINNHSLASNHFMLAITENPSAREPYVEYAEFLMQNADYHGSIHFLLRAQSKHEKPKTFLVQQRAYGNLIDDLLSLCYYHLSDKENAKKHALSALKIQFDERIKYNLDHYFC